MEDFRLEKIGKRMPYTTPDGFFTQLQQDILSKTVKTESSMPRRIVHFLTVAAAAAVLIVVCHATSQPAAPADYAAVEKAFDSLNAEDQELMMESYTANAFLYAEDTGI